MASESTISVFSDVSDVNDFPCHRECPTSLTNEVSMKNREEGKKKTRPDTRHKMRLVRVRFTFENNTGRTYGRTDGRTNGRTDGRTRPHIEMRRRI